MIRTAEGKCILFAVETGEQAEHWPIDATAMIAAGTHTAEAPEGKVVEVPKGPPRHAGVPQTPAVQTFAGPDGESPPTKAPSRKKAE